MKKFILLALLVQGTAMSAQYYDEYLGTGDNDILQDGEVSWVGPGLSVSGHVMSGFNDGPNTPLMFSATSEDASSVFVRWQYNIFADNSLFPLYPSKKCLVTEGPFAGSPYVYGLVGETTVGPNRSGVYFVPVDDAGVPAGGGPFNGYLYLIGTDWDLEVVDANYDASNNQIIIIGKLLAAGMYHYTFLLSVDATTGAINYNAICFMRDVLNPTEPQKFVYDAANKIIYIVGYYYDNALGNNEAYLQKFDVSTFTNQYFIYGTPTRDEQLNGITLAHVAGQQDLVVVGTSNFNGSEDIWAMYLDQNFLNAPVWNFTYDYLANPFTKNYGQHVVERYSAANADYEYYVGGYADNAMGGGFDMEILKLKSNGGAVGDYSYGAGSNEWGFWIDAEDNVTTDHGLNIYGISDDPNGFGQLDFNTYKAYFNGYTGSSCPQNQAPANGVQGPPFLLDYQPGFEQSFQQYGLWLEIVSSFNQNVPCSATNINGSNARLAHAGTQISVTSTLDNISIGLALQEQSEVNVSLTDIAGRTLHTQRMTAGKGSSTLTISTEGLQLSAGIYLVSVNDGTSIVSEKVFIQ